MKDRLEGLPFDRIGEDNGAKSVALQDPSGIENTGAKVVPYGADDGGVGLCQLPGAPIRVKDPESGEKRGQTPGEERLAGGNPTGNTQNWHAERSNPPILRSCYFWKRGASGCAGWAAEGKGRGSTVSSFSSRSRMLSPAGLMRWAVTKMTRLVLRC